MKLLAAATVALGLSFAGAAGAATITGLFNTGVDAGGAALPTFGGVDTHYSIIATDAPNFGLGSAITYQHPSYAPGDADSTWISGRSDGQTGAGSSHTTYRTTFSLTGLNPFTAMISGLWGTDNEGTIFLNGVSTGISLTGSIPGVLDGTDAGSFTSLHAFNISSGFVAGLNTLDFVILDTGPPSAMRVDNLSGTAAAVVPEPATWALMILGFGSAGAVLRRRRGVAAA
jgi:hypothetical protein